MFEALTRAFRFFVPDYNTRFLRRVEPILSDITDLEPKLKKLSDRDLQNKTNEFRNRIADGAALDDVLPEAFAVVREAAGRVLSMRHYDVQMIGGYVLHQGMIAEMKTGEGKTLVATLPLYLNALSGKGAHLVTVNDYLARRDSEWMGRVYNFLGLTVGVIVHDMDNDARKRAYGSDITYGTNNEFGFDYLRDNMAIYKEECVQRDLNFCIVDEVDSILIDEARTPLIISGPADTAAEDYDKFARIVKRMKRDRDYTVDEKAHSVIATEEGIAEAERLASEVYGQKIDNLYAPEHMKKVHYLEAALKAKELYKRDHNYVVNDQQEIVIIDEFTGRQMPGRRWSDGIHQSVEAKEGVPIVRENQTLGTITFQNLFRLYKKLAGMTGTAKTEAKEFGEIYHLDVIEIPTNRQVARLDHPDVVFKTEREKFEAIVERIRELHERGQPVLVGTVAIETSEDLSRKLKFAKIPHQVLNAKFHQQEAEIVAQAGRKGTVTISTNMAGRGTDIVLGGNPDALARKEGGPSPQFAPAPDKLRLWEHVHQQVLIAAEEAPGDRGSLLDDVIRRMAGEAAEAARRSRVPFEPPTAELIRATFDEVEAAHLAWQKDLAAWNARMSELSARYKAECEKEKAEVLASGGLFILGTERHDSRRIDNQLRGRSGRQGDPGESQFFLSMEDKLMRIFGGPAIRDMIEKLGWEEGEALEHDWIDRAVERSQQRVETHYFDMRKNVLKYDDVMNDQRRFIYKERRAALEREDLSEDIQHILEGVVQNLLESHLNTNQIEDDWNWAGLSAALGEIFTLDYPVDELKKLDRGEIGEVLLEKVQAIYERRETEIGPEMLRRLERIVLLQIVDENWKDHLYAMDGLREGIGLQGYAGKDPLVEYKIGATNMFNEMLERVRVTVAQYLFRLEFQAPKEANVMEENLAREHEERELFYGGGDAEAPEPKAKGAKPVSKKSKIGPNDPCPCGSGKKYKKCCKGG